MKNLTDISFQNFYFNGHWLSEFEGEIGGKSGLSPFSILPSREIKTEKITGLDGEIVYSSSYNPRTFVVPVYFKNINRIREIAGWLSTSQPVDFYYEGDTVKIKAMFDSAVDAETYILETLLAGVTELKFICHDPVFTWITETVKRYTTSLTSFTLFNDGNLESYPQIKIEGKGNISVGVNGKSFSITGLSSTTTDFMYIDGLYMTVYKNTTNYLPNFTGIFPVLKAGNNTIAVTGTCTALEILNRSRWI
jgi:predicted phage tail component-like protein